MFSLCTARKAAVAVGKAYSEESPKKVATSVKPLLLRSVLQRRSSRCWYDSSKASHDPEPSRYACKTPKARSIFSKASNQNPRHCHLPCSCLQASANIISTMVFILTSLNHSVSSDPSVSQNSRATYFILSGTNRPEFNMLRRCVPVFGLTGHRSVAIGFTIACQAVRSAAMLSPLVRVAHGSCVHFRSTIRVSQSIRGHCALGPDVPSIRLPRKRLFLLQSLC